MLTRGNFHKIPKSTESRELSVQWTHPHTRRIVLYTPDIPDPPRPLSDCSSVSCTISFKNIGGRLEGYLSSNLNTALLLCVSFLMKHISHFHVTFFQRTFKLFLIYLFSTNAFLVVQGFLVFSLLLVIGTYSISRPSHTAPIFLLSETTSCHSLPHQSWLQLGQPMS